MQYLNEKQLTDDQEEILRVFRMSRILIAENDDEFPKMLKPQYHNSLELKETSDGFALVEV